MHKSLRLDQIITSQPELGPSPPDGGYGWIILSACIFIQLMIPSLLAAYGTFLLFDQIENLTHSDEYFLWDHEITLVPIVFIAFWSLADAWFGSFNKTFKWPKTVIFCGFCLISSGNLIIWAAELHEPTIILFYFFAGAINGIGASLIIHQCEFIIKQFFQHKYIIAKNVLYLSNIVGFIVTPLLLGNLIIRHGVLETLLAYQVILSFVVLVSFVFKQPNFTLPETSTYNLLDTSSCEDEHLVFNKTIIEVQPSTSTNNNLDIENSNTSETINKANEIDRNKNRLQKKIDLDQIEVYKNDELEQSSNKNSKSKIEIRNNIRRSYTEEYQNDLDRNVNTTTDLDEIQIYSQDNITFSYENNSIYNGQSIPISSHPHSMMNPKYIGSLIQLNDTITIMKTPIFFKFMLLIFVEKLSTLVFWALYPSVIYNEVELLNVHTTIMCVTFVAIGGLVFTIFWNCFRIPRTTIKICLAVSFFVASTGFTLITSGQGKNYILFGGILSTASLSSIHVLSEIFVLQNTDGINHYAHKIVNIIVGTIIFLAAFLDIEYTECFEVVSLLQFVVASLWLTNIIYKRIKKLFE